MKKQSKVFWIIGIIVIVAVIAVAIFSTSKSNSNDTIKIGVSLPLTGDLAIIGTPMQKAIDLALTEAKQKYNSKQNFQVIYEDDKFTPAQALTNVQKLINVDKVDILITAGSPVGMAVGPIAEQSKIPHFGIASADVGGIGTYNFNHWTPPEKQAEKLVAELQKMGIKNLGIITLNHEGGIAVRDAVVKELNKADIKILIEEKFVPGTKDFRTIWSKVKAKNPQMVFFTAQTPELETLLKQKSEIGYNVPVVTIESPLYSTEPELYNNNWFVDAASPKEDFLAGFETKTGVKPFTFSGNAYDITELIVKTYSTSGKKLSQENFLKAFSNIKEYDGVMGKMTFSNNGTFLTEASIKEVRDGKITERK